MRQGKQYVRDTYSGLGGLPMKTSSRENSIEVAMKDPFWFMFSRLSVPSRLSISQILPVYRISPSILPLIVRYFCHKLIIPFQPKALEPDRVARNCNAKFTACPAEFRS